jgi:hypothetical protein
MMSVDDLLGPFDRLLHWLPQRLDGLSPATVGYVVAPTVVLVILLTPAVIVRRLLPLLVRYLVVPVLVVVTGVVTAALLIVDVVGARLFRLFWLPLTGVHYAIGDWTISGSRSVRRGGRHRVLKAGAWLGRFSRALLLLAGVVLAVLWSRGYCTRNPVDGCANPLSRWWHTVEAALPF